MSSVETLNVLRQAHFCCEHWRFKFNRFCLFNELYVLGQINAVNACMPVYTNISGIQRGASELQGATGGINTPLQVQSLEEVDSEPSPANGAVAKLPPKTSMQGDSKSTIAGADFREDGNRITRKDNLSLFLTTHLSNSTSSINSVGGSSSPRTLSASSDSAMDKKNSRKQARDASPEVSRGAPRLVNFFKRKIQAKRGKKETAVKEIYISPEGNDKWASRSGNDSRASSGGTTYSNPRESSPNLLVVHDMNSEYNPEYR